MNTYLVKYSSFNRKDYEEMVSAKNENEARVLGNKMINKHDDRDKIIEITESNDLNTYYVGK